MALTEHEAKLVERARTLYGTCQVSELADAPPDHPERLADVVEVLLCAVEDLARRVHELECPASKNW